MNNIEQSIWSEQTKESDLKHQNAESVELIVAGTNRIDNLVQQNSPINNELVRNSHMNELYSIDDDGQLNFLPTAVVVREKHGQTAPVCSLCYFSYDDSVDLEMLNKNGRYKITSFDRRVYNAVCTLYINNQTTVSLSEIFSVMNGYAKSNPSSNQLQAIEKSVTKLQYVTAFIDMTEELKANIIKDKQVLIDAGILKSQTDNIKQAVIEDKMLHCRIGTITSEQGKVFKVFHVMGEPCLLTYNRAKGTLISVPMEYLALSAVNSTEKTIAFQDYLLMRILSYKNGNMKENKILYDTLYRDSGITKPSVPKDFKRDRETILKMMDEWVEKGLIRSYKETKNGRSFVGLVFCVDKIEKENA